VIWFCALLLWTAGLFAEETPVTEEVQILGTTDIHGHYEHGDKNDDSGGWLRLAAEIRKRRDSFGADRTLVIDCGDTVQGTLPALVSRGAASMELLAAIGYDVWVPGNHEFDFGIARLAELLDLGGERTLCGNLTVTVGNTVRQPPAWRLFNRGKARIAVIGATATYLEEWLWGNAMTGYRVGKAEELLEKILPTVHAEKPDMIVLAIHQGWMIDDPRGINEVARIVRRFPEIDLVLGGHTHRDIAGTRAGLRSWYVQAGAGASHLAVVKARVDVANHAVQDIRSELVPAEAFPAADRAAREAIHDWLRQTRAVAVKRIGTVAVPVPVTGTPGESCATSELICRALAAATAAEVVFHGRLSGAELPAGPISEARLFGLIPYENNIGCAFLSGAELKQVIREQYRSRDSSSYNGLYGLKATVGKDGTVTSLCRSDGQPVPDDLRLKTAFNSYVIAGGGGRFPELKGLLRQPEARLTDTGINSRDALRDYFRQNPNLTCPPVRWLTRQP
jgi:2',3'-cyclic-nucleotide 2'-phosphodiesterase (5'-nucleotidase family)